VSSIADQPLDGVDLLPYLRGENGGDPHDMLFWRIAERNIWAVRGGDHKLVKQGKETGLYNLSKDIGETRDLGGEAPEVRAKLQKAFDEWHAELIPPRWKVFKTPEAEAADKARRERNAAKNAAE
jgi:hypothetical protein